MATKKKSKPFWAQTGRFFLYPFQPSIAIVTSLLACAPLWLTTLKDPIAFWTLCTAFVLVFSTVLFTILDHAMQGEFTPPKWSQSLVEGHLSIVLQQAAFIFGMIALVYYADHYGGRIFAYGLGAVLTFCLPAMIMVLAASRSLVEALNPIKITEFIIQLGRHYFILLGLLFLIEGGLIFCYEFLSTQIPFVVVVHWTTFITLFVSVTSFHLMGYVVYLHHETLGHGSIRDEADEVSSEHPIVSQVKECIKKSHYDSAQELIDKALNLEPLNLELNDLCHRLCLLREDDEKLEEHGYKYLRFLLQKDYRAKAQEVFMNLYRKNPKTKLTDMEQVVKMAVILDESQNYQVLVELLDGVHLVYPDHALIPKAYGFLAKVLHEQFGRDKDARKLLEFILVKYPDHPIKQAVKSQLDKIIEFEKNLKGN